MFLNKRLTREHSQKKPWLHFGESFALSATSDLEPAQQECSLPAPEANICLSHLRLVQFIP